MAFDTLGYWAFFGCALLLLAALSDRPARAALVGLGGIFYACFGPHLVVLLGGSIVANFLFGRWIGREEGSRRRTALSAALVFNLLLLGFFKYYWLVAGSAARLFGGDGHALFLNIALPAGISFITFEGIAYAVDVYRRDTPACSSLIDFGVFVSFFPHLIAGPIIRPAQFFPQLKARPPMTPAEARWGVAQIVKGLLKKIVFADTFAPIASGYFDHTLVSGHVVPPAVGLVAFSLQIYFDFSGYTDIARGCARLLGYYFPPNFERPYLSRNISDFWKRWHISLSTWLRDYLYFPLGGSRRGPVRTSLNLIVVMALGGLWHGASWNFLIWGIYQGILLLVHRAWASRSKAETRPRGFLSWLGRCAAILLTFAAVTVGWIPFRTPDFASMLAAIGALRFGGSLPFLAAEPGAPVLAAVALVYCVVDPAHKFERWLSERASLAVTGVFCTAALLLIELFGQFGQEVPFIYFRF